MKAILIILFGISVFTLAQVAETEKEWKIVANPSDLDIEKAAASFLSGFETPAEFHEEDKVELKRLKALIGSEGVELVPAELLKLKKVRSLKIDSNAVYTYPYFECRFKKKGKGIFFEKLKGSQRKSGLVFQGGKQSLVFLGASTVNDDPQGRYSGFTRAEDRSQDEAALIIKRAKSYLAIFPREDNTWEIYEFK